MWSTLAWVKIWTIQREWWRCSSTRQRGWKLSTQSTFPTTWRSQQFWRMIWRKFSGFPYCENSLCVLEEACKACEPQGLPWKSFQRAKHAFDALPPLLWSADQDGQRRWGANLQVKRFLKHMLPITKQSTIPVASIASLKQEASRSCHRDKPEGEQPADSEQGWYFSIFRFSNVLIKKRWRGCQVKLIFSSRWEKLWDFGIKLFLLRETWP